MKDSVVKKINEESIPTPVFYQQPHLSQITHTPLAPNGRLKQGTNGAEKKV